MIKFATYKFENLFNFGNSFLLSTNVKSYNKTLIKKKLFDQKIKEKMKNPLMLKEFNKKLNDANYVFFKKGFYITFTLYFGYKGYQFLKTNSIIDSIQSKLLKLFFSNPKIIEILIKKFDKKLDDENFKKEIKKRLNPYIKSHYRFLRRYINPIVKNKLKQLIKNEDGQKEIIEIVKTTLLNNNNLQDNIMDSIKSNFENIDFKNIKDDKIILDFIEKLFIKVFEKEEIKELFCKEFFNVLNKKFLEEGITKSTFDLVGKQCKI